MSREQDLQILNVGVLKLKQQQENEERGQLKFARYVYVKFNVTFVFIFVLTSFKQILDQHIQIEMY